MKPLYLPHHSEPARCHFPLSLKYQIKKSYICVGQYTAFSVKFTLRVVMIFVILPQVQMYRKKKLGLSFGLPQRWNKCLPNDQKILNQVLKIPQIPVTACQEGKIFCFTAGSL